MSQSLGWILCGWDVCMSIDMGKSIVFGAAIKCRVLRVFSSSGKPDSPRRTVSQRKAPWLDASQPSSACYCAGLGVWRPLLSCSGDSTLWWCLGTSQRGREAFLHKVNSRTARHTSYDDPYTHTLSVIASALMGTEHLSRKSFCVLN